MTIVKSCLWSRFFPVLPWFCFPGTCWRQWKGGCTSGCLSYSLSCFLLQGRTQLEGAKGTLFTLIPVSSSPLLAIYHHYQWYCKHFPQRDKETKPKQKPDLGYEPHCFVLFLLFQSYPHSSFIPKPQFKLSGLPDTFACFLSSKVEAACALWLNYITQHICLSNAGRSGVFSTCFHTNFCLSSALFLVTN